MEPRRIPNERMALIRLAGREKFSDRYYPQMMTSDSAWILHRVAEARVSSGLSVHEFLELREAPRRAFCARHGVSTAEVAFGQAVVRMLRATVRTSKIAYHLARINERRGSIQ